MIILLHIITFLRKRKKPRAPSAQDHPLKICFYQTARLTLPDLRQLVHTEAFLTLPLSLILTVWIDPCRILHIFWTFAAPPCSFLCFPAFASLVIVTQPFSQCKHFFCSFFMVIHAHHICFKLPFFKSII